MLKGISVLFRKLMINLKNENWLALFLDFCVVVMGIFIALQVTKWSDKQNEKESTVQALRLAMHESSFNIKTTDNFMRELEESAREIEKTLDSLLDCHKIEGEQDRMEHLFEQLSIAFGLPWNANNTDVLKHLNYSNNYSEKFKKELNLYLTRQSVILRNIGYIQTIERESLFQKHELVFIKKGENNNTSFYEKYKLTSEYSALCQNDEAKKYLWTALGLRVSSIDSYNQLMRFTKQFSEAMQAELTRMES